MSWRVLVGLVFWWYAMDAAIVYGGIWDSRANPTPNVEVVLANGSRSKGELRRDWDRSWLLTVADGSEVRFVDHQMMSFERPLKPRGFWAYWRSLMPVALVGAAFLIFAVVGIRARRLRSL